MLITSDQSSREHPASGRPAEAAPCSCFPPVETSQEQSKLHRLDLVWTVIVVPSYVSDINRSPRLKVNNSSSHRPQQTYIRFHRSLPPRSSWFARMKAAAARVHGPARSVKWCFNPSITAFVEIDFLPQCRCDMKDAVFVSETKMLWEPASNHMKMFPVSCMKTTTLSFCFRVWEHSRAKDAAENKQRGQQCSSLSRGGTWQMLPCECVTRPCITHQRCMFSVHLFCLNAGHESKERKENAKIFTL